jgi:L-aspartate oxidase
VHGANRLASNSLLEAMVFGARAGAAMREQGGTQGSPDSAAPELLSPCAAEAEIRRTAWEKCGIIRSEDTLGAAAAWLGAVLMRAGETTLASLEARSIHSVALLIAQAARARKESRGAHYRVDFPAQRPEFQKHSVIQKGHDIQFR